MAPSVTALASADLRFASADLRFASLPCSRFTSSLSAHPALPLAAYVSLNNVVVLSCESYAVIDVLPLGQAPLNAVAFAPPHPASAYAPLLFAGAADGSISVCSTAAPEQLSPFSLTAKLPIHKSACLAFDVVLLRHSLLLTSVSDTQLTVTLLCNPWNDPKLSVSASYDLPMRPDGPALLPHTIATHKHDDNLLFTAVAGTDKKIHVFSLSVRWENKSGENVNDDDRAASVSIDISPLKQISAHRDWVRGLAWSVDKNGMPLLASASSDASARLFRIAPVQPDDPPHPLYLQFSLDGTAVEHASEPWAVRSLCLLDEHTSTVHCLRFDASKKWMLSASLDGTVAVWDVTDPVTPSICARFGLLGGHSIHATGFFSVTFVHNSSGNNDTANVLAAGFSGAIHRWRAPHADATFTALSGVGGHSAAVRQVAWAPDGSFLLSASDDKSVRAFVDVGENTFVEWARPQVHGHAIASIAFCNTKASRYVSAAEERMLRLFDAPDAFRLPGDGALPEKRGGVRCAKLPELGLSNKAVFSSPDNDTNVHSDVYTNGVSHHDASTLQNGNHSTKDNAEGEQKIDDMRVTLTGSSRGAGSVPLEEELKQETLWPETAKLYGHGNEVIRVATDPTVGTIASACHAQNERDAGIIIWDGLTGIEVAHLTTHNLSVTDLRFSPDGKWLASVSRDRSLAVFWLRGDQWTLFDRLASAHSRVIFACAWLFPTKYVATAGRDKCLRVFQVNGEDVKTTGDFNGSANCRIVEKAKLKFDSAVTSVDCCPYRNPSFAAVAVGLESGDFCIVRARLPKWQRAGKSNNGDSSDDIELQVAFRAQERMRCGAKITTVQWRPRSKSAATSPNGNGTSLSVPFPGDEDEESMHLALGSEDMSVRIYTVHLTGGEISMTKASPGTGTT